MARRRVFVTGLGVVYYFGPCRVRPRWQWITPGALFAAGYPRYLWIAASVVLGSAVLFELLQVLEPSRHGRLFDAAVKIAGGLTGLTAGWLWARLLQRMR